MILIEEPKDDVEKRAANRLSKASKAFKVQRLRKTSHNLFLIVFASFAMEKN